MRATLKVGLIALLLLPAFACTRYVVETPAAAVGAQLSVERFLQAANERDVEAMGRLFGTADGSAMETGGTFGCMFKKIGSWFGGTPCVQKHEVEIRMDAIASILQHRDYRIVDERRVAGRSARTTQVMVDMTTELGVQVRAVPFEVVRTDEGRWLVQRVDLERVMAAR